MIICDRLLGGWKLKYMGYGFFGRWVLNQQSISVNLLDIFFRGMRHNPSSMRYPLSTAFSHMMILVVFPSYMLMHSLSNILTYSAFANFTPISSEEYTSGTRSTSFTGDLYLCASFILSVADMVLLLGMTKTFFDFLTVSMKYFAYSSAPTPDLAPVS